MVTRTFQAKEIIFREGEAGDAAYIIESGSVEILKKAEHGEVQLAVLQTGSVFGEMALFEPKNSRSATVRALETTTVDVISDAEFKSLVASAPPRLIPIVSNVVQRLRDVNQRLAAKERTTVVLDSKIEEITISSACDALAALKSIVIKTGTLPFTIGGYPESEENPRHNDLDLPSEGPPLIISQKHCKIERTNDGVFLVDVGSRFCTIVNGTVIGRGKVSERAPLQLGQNKVTLGDFKSPYKLLIECK